MAGRLRAGEAAQGHLAGQRVGPGDVFLFFGWFRHVEEAAGGWRYRRGAPDIRALFGWLQVGEVVDTDDRLEENRAQRAWLADHPHLNAHGVPGNTVYLAADTLTLGGAAIGLPGAGTFGRYREGLRLTRAGATRTVWDLPGWFMPEGTPTLTYHADPTRWTRDGLHCTLRSVAKGQEFVMDCSSIPEAAEWLGTLLTSSLP